LRKYGLSVKDMNTVGTFSSNEAIRKILRFVVGFSFLSEYAVRGDDFIIKLRIANFEPITRRFYIVRDRNRPVPNIAQELINFLLLRSKTML